MNKTYNKRHGSPFDRGQSDSYYGRPKSPHYYKGNTGTSERVTQDRMSKEEMYCGIEGSGRTCYKV